jgi:anti-sigma-K factor RskA
VRTATLAATGSPPSARLFWNPVRGTVVIVAFDLPPAPAGRTYQLWGIAPGGDPVSLGTFQTAADGTALVQRPAPGGIPFEVGAVTEEPAGGSPQPTTQPFLVGSWAAQ